MNSGSPTSASAPSSPCPRGRPPGRPLARRAIALGWIAAFALIGSSSWLACKGPDERSAAHVERARELLEEPARIKDLREAALELRNAVALDPDGVEANALLGQTLLSLGVTGEALQYLEDAHQLAPNDADITVNLARTLLFSDPQRTLEVADQALTVDPDSVPARLVIAEALALQGDYAAAHVRVDEAQALVPELPEVDWMRARVRETELRSMRLKPGRTVFKPADFQATVDAYDAYIAKGGSNVSTVLLSKAKLLASWPGHGSEAIVWFKKAAEAAEADPSALASVLETMARFARTLSDREAELYALARLTELDPWRIDQWELRVRVARGLERPVDPILEEMLEKVGDDPRAHVVYARALRDDQGLAAAVGYLRDRIDAGDEAPILLSQLVQLQTQGGRPKDGARTFEELQRKHPNDIETRLLMARRDMIAGDLEEAHQAIVDIADKTGSREALRVLSRVQQRMGRTDAALATIERIIADDEDFNGRLWAHKARLLLELDRPSEALAALQRLDWGEDLTQDQQLLRARCEYALGRRAAARQRLINLLAEPDASIEAVLEFHTRERDHPGSLHKLLETLLAAHERAPESHAVIAALTDVSISLGRPEIALLRISRTLEKRPRDPVLYALRARTLLLRGQVKLARNDAERALMLTPGRGDDALAVLIALSDRTPDPEQAIATLDRQRSNGRLGLHRMVVLGRLMASQGRPTEALAIFEEALAGGAQFTVLMTDTAYLLLATGGDIDRAEALAQEAVSRPGEQVVAADVLGLIYMTKGIYDAAMYQFQFAVDHVDAPNPNYLLHLGQAYEGLRRIERAREAYARALEIDPQHAESRTALGALDGAAAAPRTDPS